MKRGLTATVVCALLTIGSSGCSDAGETGSEPIDTVLLEVQQSMSLELPMRHPAASPTTTINPSAVAVYAASNSGQSIGIAKDVNIFEGLSVTAWGVVANSGTGTVKLGVGADVGSLWSIGNVDFPSGSAPVVHGDLRTAGSADEAAGQVTGLKFEPASIDRLRTTVAVDFPVVAGSPFTISSGSQTISPGAISDVFVNGGTLTINPGSYGALTVNGGTVVMTPGVYTFTNVAFTSGTFSPTTTAAVRVNVRDGLVFRGACSAFSPANVRWAVFGSAGAKLSPRTSPDTNVFRGTVVAMNGPLVITEGIRTYRGAFFGKTATVPLGALVQHVAFSAWEPPG